MDLWYPHSIPFHCLLRCMWTTYLKPYVSELAIRLLPRLTTPHQFRITVYVVGIGSPHPPCPISYQQADSTKEYKWQQCSRQWGLDIPTLNKDNFIRNLEHFR